MFFFHFEIILDVSVRTFRFICIPILWVYGHYTYFNSFSAGTVFSGLSLTPKDGPRAEVLMSRKGMHIDILNGIYSKNNLICMIHDNKDVMGLRLI